MYSLFNSEINDIIYFFLVIIGGCVQLGTEALNKILSLIHYLPITANITYYTLFFDGAFLILIVVVAYLFYFSIFFVSNTISTLCTYQEYDRKNKKEVKENFLIIFRCYLIMIIPTYFTIIILLHPQNTDINWAFLAALPIISSYLISLRILANPTKKRLFKLNITNSSPLSPQDKEKIKIFRERVIGFYFALTETAIFFLIMDYLFETLKNRSITIFFKTFIPDLSVGSWGIFLGAFLLALFVTTWLGERLLEKWEPIPIIDM